MGQFRVRVTKDYLVFCAGHFITYNGDQCETLHGHNYRVCIQLDGPVDANQYVFDFVALKHMARKLVNELDHRMLLPMYNPLIGLHEQEEGFWVHVSGAAPRRYFFPREDVVVLPVPNTTVEMLAHYLCGRLCQELSRPEQHAGHLTAMTVEVEETTGQSGSYAEEIRLPVASSV